MTQRSKTSLNHSTCLDMTNQHKKYTDALIQSGKSAIKLKLLMTSCECSLFVFGSRERHVPFSHSIRCIPFVSSHLYKASLPIHASHDEDILKTGNLDKKNDTVQYCQKHVRKDVLVKLQSCAFRSLCEHLHDRSDEVQNMDLMTISGFCRNCLAKVCTTVVFSSYKMRVALTLLVYEVACCSSSSDL